MVSFQKSKPKPDAKSRMRAAVGAKRRQNLRPHERPLVEVQHVTGRDDGPGEHGELGVIQRRKQYMIRFWVWSAQ